MEEEGGAGAGGSGGALRVGAGDVGLSSIVQEWSKVRCVFACVCACACGVWVWYTRGSQWALPYSMERPCYPLCKREWDSGSAVALAVLDGALGLR